MITYFCSSNPDKHADAAWLFRDSMHPPRPLHQAITEVLSADLKVLVREKALTAYRRAPVCLFVEHGGLYIDALAGLPGTLVKVFCEQIKLAGLCALLPPLASRRATFRHMICYCDGKALSTFEGAIVGTIADSPRGAGGIHWDPVFIPDGESMTMGEMHPERRLEFFANAGAIGDFRRKIGI